MCKVFCQNERSIHWSCLDLGYCFISCTVLVSEENHKRLVEHVTACLISKNIQSTYIKHTICSLKNWLVVKLVFHVTLVSNDTFCGAIHTASILHDLTWSSVDQMTQRHCLCKKYPLPHQMRSYHHPRKFQPKKLSFTLYRPYSIIDYQLVYHICYVYCKFKHY